MRTFIIRILITTVLLFFTIYLYSSGSWGWGIFFTIITALVGMTFIYNENVALALNHMRSGNQEKAQASVNRITHPHLLPKRQHAYVLYLQSVMNVQSMPHSKSESMLRKALGMGLKRGHDQAMAKMQLAGICAQTGRKQDAITLLNEAKKADNTGMMKDQIKMMLGQLQNAPSKNQMRMAQMMGGRKKTPKMR
jgi:hypothetical protein